MLFLWKDNFHLWSGCGYCLDTVVASGYCFEDALDNLVCGLISQNKAAYFLTCEDMDRLRLECGLNDDQDPEGYIYIDATMNGAPYPVYLLVENMQYNRLS